MDNHGELPRQDTGLIALPRTRTRPFAVPLGAAILGILLNLTGISAAGMGTEATAGGIAETKLARARPGAKVRVMGHSIAVDGDTMVIGAPYSYSYPVGWREAGAVQIYRSNGAGAWILEAQLNAPDAAEGDRFGFSVGISGDTVVVGASSDSDLGHLAGAAYVYVRSGSSWTLQTRLIPSDARGGFEFGWSVSVSGNTAIVGTSGGGVAYVFTRAGSAWSEEAKLTPPAPLRGHLFGYSVSISGDTAVIGAIFTPDSLTEVGSAYVFTRSGSTWTLQAELNRPDPEPYDRFGHSVSVDGDTAIVGVIGDDDGGSASGSAYVYTRSGSLWTLQSKLVASDAEAVAWFGCSVSISNETAVVGAWRDDDGGEDSGATYIFTRRGSTWTQRAKLTASDAAEGDRFGSSVSISGDTVGIGAEAGDSGIRGSGSVYVFNRSGATWTQQRKLDIVGDIAGDMFGDDVSISGDTVVVGASRDDTVEPDSGSVSVFRRSGSAWTQEATLLACDAAEDDAFGATVAISGDTAVVGAQGSDGAGPPGSGSAYVFTRSDSVWSPQAKLTATDAAWGDWFGGDVAISGDTAIIGANGDDDGGSDSGSAYVFARSGSAWNQQAKLTASDAAPDDCLGFSVSVSGDTAVVGAVGDNAGIGSVYVFTRSGSTWKQQARLTASDAATGDHFGWSVALSSDTLVVGAKGDDVGALSDAGSAFVFTRSGSRWTQQAKLTASDAATGDCFGNSVSVSGNIAVVGAYQDDGVGANSGAAYVFLRIGSIWSQQARVIPSNAAKGDYFGESVAIDAKRVVVGVPWKNAPWIHSGLAYLYDLESLAPRVSFFALDNAMASTTRRSVTLENRCTNSPTHYMASEDAAFTGAEWQTYATAPPFVLSPGNGAKTVFFRAKNEFGESAVVSDTILLDLPVDNGGMWVLF